MPLTPMCLRTKQTNENGNHFIMYYSNNKKTSTKKEAHDIVGGWRRFDCQEGLPFCPLLTTVFSPPKLDATPKWHVIKHRQQCCHQMELALVPLEGLGRYLVSMTLQRPSVRLTPLIQATERGVRVRVRVKTQETQDTGRRRHGGVWTHT